MKKDCPNCGGHFNYSTRSDPFRWHPTLNKGRYCPTCGGMGYVEEDDGIKDNIIGRYTNPKSLKYDK